MPFCPKCRDEFQEWVKTCPDCHVALVAELPLEPAPTPRGDRSHRAAESDRSKEPLALVTSSSNEPEAKMWAGILEDNGIHCMVKPYAPGGYASSRSPMASVIQPSSVLQFDVYVLESDAERARERLGRISDPDAEIEAAEEQPAESTGSRDAFVALTAPQEEIEAKMLAETLENNGIRAVAKIIPGYVKGGRYHKHQVYVRRSDVGRAKKIVERISDPVSGAEIAYVQPAKTRRFSTTTAGIVEIVNRAAYLAVACGLAITTALHVAIPVAVAIIGILAVAGGVCTLRRVNWWLAVAGAIVSMVPFFPIALMGGSRDEFE